MTTELDDKRLKRLRERIYLFLNEFMDSRQETDDIALDDMAGAVEVILGAVQSVISDYDINDQQLSLVMKTVLALAEPSERLSTAIDHDSGTEKERKRLWGQIDDLIAKQDNPQQVRNYD